MGTSDKNTLIETALALLEELSHTSGRQKRNSWNELSLTIGQLKSLFFIDFEGCTSVKRVAGAIGMAPSNATAVVDYLVKEGLVSRREDPGDRRRLKLETTAKGKSLLSNLKEGGVLEMSVLLPYLDAEDLAHLTKGLKALAATAKRQHEKPVGHHSIIINNGAEKRQKRKE
jgi:DNA-binding MarR family transcriptional regulator